MNRNANYRQIPALLTARKEFTGSSMSATVANVPGAVVDGEFTVTVQAGDYIVWSYASVIAVKFADNGVIVWNPDIRKSQTTMRQINLCKAYL